MLAIALTSNAGAQSPSVDASSPPVKVSVAWVGNQPTSVVLDDGNTSTHLTLQEANTRFEARLAPNRSDVYLVSAALTASYPDEDDVSLYVRLWPALRGVEVKFFQVKVTSCSVVDIQAAELPGGSVDAALKAMFTARAYYKLQGVDACTKSNRREAAKAWFDRAYELTTLRNYFDLSPEASAAYEIYDPGYVSTYSDQAKGLALKTVYSETLNASHAGDHATALVLNQSLEKLFTERPDLATLGARLQSLTPARRRKDGSALKSAAQGDALTTSSAPLKLEVAPVQRSNPAG